MGKKNLNITMCAMVFAIILVIISGQTAVYADSTEGRPEVAETTVATVTRTVKKGLVREKDGYHYYIKGKTIKNKWKKIKGRYYWFKSDGVAARNGACKVKGTYYVFDSLARKLTPGKTKAVRIQNRTYLVDKKGKAVKGWKKLGNKVYYASKTGKCAVNQTVDGIRLNKNGYATSTKALCKVAARRFISLHTTSKMSKRQKLRACFNQIIWYNRFVGNMDPTPAEFKKKTWVYKYALQMFQNGLTGNCYGISSSVAAVAKELGYQPYVITIPDGHSFVMIDGLYYDNMYGTLFGASSRPAYTVQYKIKF